MFPYYLLPNAGDTQEPDADEQPEETQPWLPLYIYPYPFPPAPPVVNEPVNHPPATSVSSDILDYEDRQRERPGHQSRGSGSAIA